MKTKRRQYTGHSAVLIATVFIVIFSSHCRAATIVWTNSAGGSWGTTANWSPNQLPTAVDDAYITNSGIYAVTLNTVATVASLTLGGASGTQYFTNSNQTLTLNGASVINGNGLLVLGGGTITGAGSLTINSAFLWTGGTMSGTGTIFANGGLTITGGSTKTLTSRTLVNAAAGVWTGGTITFSASGILSNSPSGTFDCAFDGAMQGSGVGGSVANAGLFRKTTGTATTALSSTIAFNNTGSVEVQTGTLSLGGGGTSTGTFTALAGTTLDLQGVHNLSTTATVTGAGSLSVSGGTANLAGGISIAASNTISGGVVNISSNFGIAGSILNITGGTANFNGTGAIMAGAVNLTAGALGGSNNLTAGGPMIWSGGIISGTGTIFANGGLTITGGSTKTLTSRTLVNAAAGVWTGGTITFSASGILSNSPSGTFDCAFDGAMQGSGVGGSVANAGLFRKTTGTATTALSSTIAFNNTGSVEVQTGTLSLGGGGTSTGTFTALAGTTLDLGGGIHNFTASSSVSGVGTFSVSGGTANLAGSLNVAGTNSFSAGTANFSGSYAIVGGTLNISGGTASFNGDGMIIPGLLNLTAGTLGGSNNVTVGTPMIWSGGTISGTGTVVANGGLTISGGSTKTLTSRTLVNAAAGVWT
ncbi:MAG: hypothetical protein WCS94_20025, partial [Verrucomicrobiota bacterium]